MRLPKTAKTTNDGFTEVRRRGIGGRRGGQGRSGRAGRGSSGRIADHGGRNPNKKDDETMKENENTENVEKVDADANGKAPTEDDVEPEMEDCIEEYEEESEETTAVATPEEQTGETAAKNSEKPKKPKENEGKMDNKPAYDEAKERLRERGDGYVETFTQHSTQIKIEYNVKEGTTFGVRSSLIKTLEAMKKVDPTMAIISRTSKIYDKFTELPTGDKFTDEIKVSEYNPPRAATKITCYVILQSKEKFNVIKYDNKVMEFLKQNQVYIRVDNYNNSPVSIPGFLIKLHPSLTRIDNLTEELTDAIKELTINNDSEDFQEWAEAHKHEYDPETNAEGIHPVPHFRLTSGKRSFGGVTTNVLLVECAKVDARFVKYVLTKIYNDPKLDTRGFFVPSGIHLIESPKLYTALLQRQNMYLNNLAVVTVFGLPYETLGAPITVAGYEGDLSGYFNYAAPEIIETMELTGQTEETGKWFVICTKTSLKAVQEFFDYNIKNIFVNQIPSTEKFADYPFPTRFLGSTTRDKGPTRTVDTVGKEYAAVLLGIVSTPQTVDLTSAPADINNAPPLRPNKRQHVTLTYTDTESFPPLPAKRNPVEAPPTQGQPTMATNTTPTQETAATPAPTPVDFSQKLTDMNIRLKGQMERMKATQDKQMGEMLTAFEGRFTDMQARMEASHNELRGLIITMQQSMTTMMGINPGTKEGTSVTSKTNSTLSDGSKGDDKNSTSAAIARN
jgi:hypothetical protein